MAGQPRDPSRRAAKRTLDVGGSYRDFLLAWAEECVGEGTDWPGLPIVQIPLRRAPDLHALVDAGKLRLVKRQGARVMVTYAAPEPAARE